MVSEDASLFPLYCAQAADQSRYGAPEEPAVSRQRSVHHQPGHVPQLFPEGCGSGHHQPCQPGSGHLYEKIAHKLGITARYVGEEPTSVVTGLYNQVMQQKLPEAGIQCIVVPRREEDGQVVEVLPPCARPSRRTTGTWCSSRCLPPPGNSCAVKRLNPSLPKSGERKTWSIIKGATLDNYTVSDIITPSQLHIAHQEWWREWP